MLVLLSLGLFVAAKSIDVSQTLHRFSTEITKDNSPAVFNFLTPSLILVTTNQLSTNESTKSKAEIKWNGTIEYKDKDDQNKTIEVNSQEPIIMVNESIFTMKISSSENLYLSFAILPFGSMNSKCDGFSINTDITKDYIISYKNSSSTNLQYPNECIWFIFPNKTKISKSGSLDSGTNNIYLYKDTVSTEGIPFVEINKEPVENLLLLVKTKKKPSITDIKLSFNLDDGSLNVSDIYKDFDLIRCKIDTIEGIYSYPTNLITPIFGNNKIELNGNVAGIFLPAFMAIYIHDFGSDVTFIPEFNKNDPLFESENKKYIKVSSTAQTKIIFSAASLNNCGTRYVYGKSQTGNFIADKNTKTLGSNQHICVWIPTEVDMSVNFKTDTYSVEIFSTNDIYYDEDHEAQIVSSRGFLLKAVTSNLYWSPVKISFTKESSPINGRDYTYVYPTGHVKGELRNELSCVEMKAGEIYHFCNAGFYLYFQEKPDKIRRYYEFDDTFINSSFYYVSQPAAFQVWGNYTAYYVPVSRIDGTRNMATNGNEHFVLASDDSIYAKERNVTITYYFVDRHTYLILLAPRGASSIKFTSEFGYTYSATALELKDGAVEQTFSGTSKILTPPVALLLKPSQVKNGFKLEPNGKLYATEIYNGTNKRNIMFINESHIASYEIEEHDYTVAIVLGSTFGGMAVLVALSFLITFSHKLCAGCCLNCCPPCCRGCCCCCEESQVYPEDKSSSSSSSSKKKKMCVAGAPIPVAAPGQPYQPQPMQPYPQPPYPQQPMNPYPQQPMNPYPQQPYPQQPMNPYSQPYPQQVSQQIYGAPPQPQIQPPPPNQYVL